MANTMRWRYGETNPVVLAVAAETVIEIGDLVYVASGAAKPAGDQADQLTEAANQEAFHDAFAGVALQQSRAGDTDPIRVATTGVFEFACASDTFEVGELVGVDEAGSGTALENQVVAPMDPDNPDGAAVGSLRHGANRYPAAGARVTATYETLPDASEPPRGDLPGVPHGTYLTFRADLGSELVTTPARGWHWDAPDDPPLPPDLHPGVIIPTGVFRLIWHRVAAPNWSAIRQLRGKVNATTFVGGALGTVLFMGARIVREFEFGRGHGFWRVEYLFSERAIDLGGGDLAGWNHMYKEEPVDGQHWLRVLNATGQTLYAEADLMPLFTFGP